MFRPEYQGDSVISESEIKFLAEQDALLQRSIDLTRDDHSAETVMLLRQNGAMPTKK